MKPLYKILLPLATTILIVGAYFMFYVPYSLAQSQQACADLEPVFREGYSQLNATSTNMETALAFEHHFSTTVGKCYIKVQRHDSMEGSYTTADKTILYDTVADKTAASCVTLLQREVVINTECKSANETITKEQFDAIEKSYMSD